MTLFLRFAVWFLFIFGGIFGGIYFDSILFPGIHKNSVWHIFSFLAGVFLMSAVIKISKNTGKTLAKFGKKGEVKKLDTNVLVKEGIYSCMRHPMHLGLMLFPLSFAFLTGVVSFIVIIAPFEVFLMLIMIFTLEEQEAIKKFGKEYSDYKKEVPAFSFKKDCLKMLFENVKK